MRIGILVGMEQTFPRSLTERLSVHPGVEVEFLRLVGTPLDVELDYDLILDRISHEIAFYRAVLLKAAQDGVRIVNHPVRLALGDRFSDLALLKAVGLHTPKTILLPQKEYGPTVTPASLRNLGYPVDWDGHFAAVGSPAVLRSAETNGHRFDVTVHSVPELIAAFDATGQGLVLLQEAIPVERYVRCLVIGGERVIVARFDPVYRTYVFDPDYLDAENETRIVTEAAKAARALGFDFLAIDFAITDSHPVIVDLSPTPDLEISTLTPFFFEKVVDASAAYLIEEAAKGRRKGASASLAEHLETVPGLMAHLIDVPSQPSAAVTKKRASRTTKAKKPRTRERGEGS